MSSIDLHHVTAGSDEAPPLLLAASLGTNHTIWAPHVQALQASRRVIAFDHRGHGASPVPPGPYTIADLGGDVLALMDRLEIERSAYVGLSIGGMVGLWLAINAPERIDSLVVLCSTAHPGPPEPWWERAATVREAGTPGALADTVVSRWFSDAFKRAEPERVTVYRDMIAATAAEGYAGCCEAISGHDVRSRLDEITAPTLVVGGAEDTALPLAHSELIAAGIPGARLEVLDPAAHLSPVERPEAVVELISDHLGVRAG